MPQSPDAIDRNRVPPPPPPPQSADPFAALSFVPAWVQAAGDAVGEKVSDFLKTPTSTFNKRTGKTETVTNARALSGATNTLSALNDATIRTPAGLVALGFDEALGTNREGKTGLAAATDAAMREQGVDPNSVLGKLQRPKFAAETLYTGLQKVAEDPTASGPERAIATGARLADTVGGAVAPLVPGVGALRKFGEPALDAAKLSERTGAVAVAQRAADRTARTVADTSPEQMAAVDAIGKSVDAHVGNVVDFPNAAAVGPQGTTNLGDLITKAGVNKQKRMDALIKRVVEGDPVSGKEATELLDFARAELPDQASEFERVLRPVIDEQATIDALRKDLKSATQDVKAADRTAGKVGNAELRAEERVTRAEMAAENVRSRIDTSEARTDLRRAATFDAQAAKTVTKTDGAIAAAKANLDAVRAAEANPGATLGQVGVPTRNVYKLTAQDAERLTTLGYQSEKDLDILARTGINMGKVFDPEEAAQFAKTVMDNPQVFAAKSATITLPESLREAASYLGAATDDLEREMARRGFTAGDSRAFLLGANLTMKRLSKEYRALAESGASKEVLDAAYAKYLSFSAKVGGANSEAGGTLGVLRINRVGNIIDNIRVNNMRVSAKARVDKIDLAVAKAETALADTIKERDLALSAVESARDASAKKAAEVFAARRAEAMTKAQANLDAKRLDLANAQLEYGRAIDAAAAASDKAHGAALAAATKGGVDPKAAKALLEIDPEDAVALADAMRNLHKISGGQRLAVYASANLYSGLISLEYNAIGGAMRTLEHIVLQLPARKIVSPIIARITGEAPAFGRTETMRQTIVSAISGAPQAATSGMKVMLNGMDDDLARAADIVGPRPFRGPKGLVVEPALRFNSAADSMARTEVGIIEMRDIAQREAERLLGPAATTEQIAAQAVKFVKDPTTAMLDEVGRITEGINYGAKLSKIEEGLMGFLNTRVDLPLLGATPVLKIVTGPTRFAWASTKFSFEASGLGIFKAIGLARKGPEFHRQASYAGARGMIGGTVLAGGLGLYTQGLVMGKDPEGKGRDDSVLVNGQWISMRPFWPLSGPIIYAGRIGDGLSTPGDWDDKLGVGIGGIAESVANQPILRFVHDVYDAVYRGGSQAERLVANLIATRLIPDAAAVRDIDRIINNAATDPDGFWQEATKNIPIINRNLEPQIDKWGQVKRIPGGEGLGRLNPLTSKEQKDPRAERLRVIGVNVSDFDPKLESVDIDGLMLTQWRTLGGQARAAAVDKTLTSAGFDSLTVPEQNKVMTKAIAAALKTATDQFAEGVINDATQSPEDRAKGIAIGVRNTPGLNERAHFIEQLLPLIDKDPALAAATESELRGRVRGPVIEGSKLTRVVDGDTVVLDVKKGTPLPGKDLGSFRLAGVDVPELNTPEGKRAAAALAEFLAGKTLTFQAEKADNFGRNLVALKADGISVSDWLIQSGYGKERQITDAPADKFPLDTYRKVIPFLKEVEKMPRFANPVTGAQVGNEQIWDQYDTERKQYEEIGKRTDLSDAQKASARASFKVTHPVYREYASYSPQNKKKSEYIANAEKQGIPLSKFLPDN